MFILRVHSVDTKNLLSVDEPPFSKSPKTNPNLYERRGISHLYKNPSFSSLTSPKSLSTTLFVVAVPNYMSADELIRYFGSHVEDVGEILFLRNDAMEDRYSVLVKFGDELKANAFYGDFNGKRFSPSEAEVCHILYLLVEFLEVAEIASCPPVGFTELPTCPICLERLDPDTSGILSTLCDHSFQCSCTLKWTYLSCPVCRLCQQQDEKPACAVCGTLENLWACLICGFVGCGRYKEKHGISHWQDTQHCYSLDLRTKQIWDYVGDNYVHRLNQSKADGKSADMNSPCISLDRALCSSKVEATVNEYNHLLATQLEAQRQYYESLIVEAKSKRESSISEAVEKAVTSSMQDIQHKLAKCDQEKNAVAEVNRNLIKNQEVWRKKLKEIEERESSSLSSRDERIVDLEEQIRDLKVYVEAQKTLGNMTNTDDIKGGTLLPVPSRQSSSSNSKRSTKSSRRRN